MVIFSNKSGQLGNRLFCFAHIIANAAENRYHVINLSFDEYAQFFDTTGKDLLCRYPSKETFVKSPSTRSYLFLLNKAILKILRLAKIHSSPVHLVVTADLPEYQFKERRSYDLKNQWFQRKVRRTPFVFLFGRFFRDYENLHKHQDQIRSFFQPVTSIREHAKAVVEKARASGNLVVGVHIRRGDYQNFAGGKYFYTQEQYAAKMSEVVRCFPGSSISFVVCSNEFIEPLSFPGLSVVKGTGHLVEDMYALAECDMIMGPPSTFTLWASFYGNRPLYQIKDIDKSIGRDDFVHLPPEILYNFSFN